MKDHDDQQPDRLEKIEAWVDDEHELPTSDLEIDDELVGEQLLIDSLLQGHFESGAQQETRVQAVLERFDRLEHEDSPGIASSRADKIRPGKNRSGKAKLTSLVLQGMASLAAILLAGAFIWNVSMPQSAEAAMQTVIRSIEAHVTRVYEGTVEGKWLGIERSLTCTVRSLGSDKFVVEMHDTLIKPKVIGADGEERWYVAGRRIWNSGEAQKGLRNSLLNNITVRNLAINQLITQIPDNYELKLLDVVPLPGDDSVSCRPIEATRIGDDDTFPELVRVWAHPVTGVVVRMEFTRQRSNRRPPTQIVLVLVGEEPVAEEIFRPEHYVD